MLKGEKQSILSNAQSRLQCVLEMFLQSVLECPRKPKIKMKADSRISVTANPTQFICYPYGAIACCSLCLHICHSKYRYLWVHARIIRVSPATEIFCLCFRLSPIPLIFVSIESILVSIAGNLFQQYTTSCRVVQC